MLHMWAKLTESVEKSDVVRKTKSSASNNQFRISIHSLSWALFDLVIISRMCITKQLFAYFPDDSIRNFPTWCGRM